MNKIWVISSYILRIIFVLCGTYLALSGIKGWGWFIFGAIVCSVSERSVEM